MKKTTRIFGILLIAAMLLGAFPLTASAADGDACTVTADCTGTYSNGFCTVCDGYEPATDSNGDGYYEIDNAGKLYWFAAKAEANTHYNVKLTADIVINPGAFDTDGNYTPVNGETVRAWTPIGKDHNASQRYNKTFDGNGHTISGLYINSNTGNVGLFAQAGRDSSHFAIKNLGMVNSFIGGNQYGTGSFVGIAYGGSISNCYSSATVKGSMYSGGIAGRSVKDYTSFTISNCFYFGTLTGSTGQNGGGTFYTRAIASQYFANSPTIKNCYYYGNSSYTDSRATAVTEEQMKSGELAWLLNGSKSDGAWGQTIGEDAHPVFATGSNTVYPNGKCTDSTYTYSNTGGLVHDTTLTAADYYNTDGTCKICNAQAVASVTVDGTVTYYSDFAAAITAAKAASTTPSVKMLANVTLTEQISISKMKQGMELDFAGKTIYHASDTPIVWSWYNGTLTLRDSVGGGGFTSGKFSAFQTYSPAEIYGGTFKASVNNDNTQAGAVSTGSGCTLLTIYGGTFESTDGALLLNGVKVVIYGGSFTGTKATFDRRDGSVQVYAAEFPNGIIRDASYKILLSKVLASDCYLKDADGNLISTEGEVYEVSGACSISKGADLADAVVTVDGSYTYTGVEIKPEVTVTVDGKTVDAANYTVTYENNIYVGQATAIVTAKGDIYTGSVSGTFTIGKATPEQSDFVVDYPDYYYEVSYSGEAKTVTVTASVFSSEGMGEITVKYFDANGDQIEKPINAGTYIVKIDVAEGDNYLAAADLELATFTITPATLSADSFRLTADSFTYNGAEQKPDVYIIVNDTNLREGRDYTLSWPADMTNAGTKTVTVTGNYAGSFTYEIKKADPTVVATSPISSVLSGNKVLLSATASYGGLTEGLPTSFAITNATNATWDGMVITVNDGLVIGQDTVTVTVSCLPTDNYNAVTDTITLNVGMADYSAAIAELEEAIAELKALADSKADATEIAEKLAEITNKINALEQNGATDAELAEAVAEVKSELAAAVSNLEDKIAEEVEKLQGQIDSNDTDIADIQAAIEEINGLIDALEAADVTLDGKIADAVNTAKNELAAAVSALEAKIAEEVEKLQSQIDSTKKELDQAIIDLNVAIEKGDSDLSTEIEKLNAALAAAQAALEKADADNKAELVAKIEAANATLDAAIKAVQKNLEDAQKELNDAITNGDTALEAKIQALSDALASVKAALETADAANKAELESKIAATQATLQTAIDKVASDLLTARIVLQTAITSGDAELDAKISALNTALENAQAALEAADAANKAELEQALAIAEATLREAISAVQSDLDSTKAKLDQAIADLNQAIASGDSALDAKITALNTALTEAKAALEAADAANKTELEGKITAAQTTLQTAIDKVAADLAQAKTELETAIASGDKALDAKITALNTALENAQAAMEAADAANKTELEGKITAAQTALQAAIDKLAADLEQAKTELETAIANGDTALDDKITALNGALAEVKAALKATNAADKADLMAKIDEADAALQAAVDALASELNSVKQALEKADADNRTFIIIVCVISSLAFCGCGTIAVFYFIIDRKKKI